jgi:mono/diheme cytochrome c family protein
MKTIVKAVGFVVVAAGLISGCGSSGGGSTPAAGLSAASPAASAPSSTVDGAALYATNCAGCHGALAVSSKKGATAAQIQVRMDAPPYAKTILTTAEVQAIADALAVTPPTTTPPPATTVGGAALYATNCAGCHGALAVSAKKGATAAQIQVRMDAPPYAKTILTTAEVQAIAGALAVTTPPGTTVPPPPPATAACGSCHAIPPATGEHAFHTSQRVGCATCHGSAYSTTTFDAATHNNGVKNLTTTIGWNPTSRSCSNSCHGRKTW